MRPRLLGTVTLATLVLLLRCTRAGQPAPAPSPRATPATTTTTTRAPVAAPDASAAPPPAATAAPRELAWREIGTGVAARETDAPEGASDLFVALAGWRITDASVRAWSDALYTARLSALGVRRMYAVRGPAEVDHRSHELATALLADELFARATPRTRAVLVVAHSSGALVAAELFYRMFRARPDGGAALRDRVLFVSLDGDADVPGDPLRELSPETVGALRHAWFVTARDPVRGVRALSNATMRAQQQRYPDRSDFIEYDARDAGCTAVLCVHVSLVNPHPLPRGNASYATFGPEGPNVTWLEPVAARWAR